MESIRTQRLMAKLAAERLERRLTADADARATLDAWHRDWLDRRRAAARLGITPRTLKAWQLAGRGPAPVKFGPFRQSRVAWRASDIDAFLGNPGAFGTVYQRHPAGVSVEESSVTFGHRRAAIDGNERSRQASSSRGLGRVDPVFQTDRLDHS
jgi:hypothetical protein